MVTFNPLEARRCVQFSALEDEVKERVEPITLSISLMEQEGVSVGEPGQTVVDIIDSTGMYVCTCVYVCMHTVTMCVFLYYHGTKLVFMHLTIIHGISNFYVCLFSHKIVAKLLRIVADPRKLRKFNAAKVTAYTVFYWNHPIHGEWARLCFVAALQILQLSTA